MKNRIRNIIAVALSLNLLLSTVGINLSIHTCNAANSTDISLDYGSSSHSDHDGECSTCSAQGADHECGMEETQSEPDCCSGHSEAPKEIISIEKDKCCSESAEFIQTDYESVTNSDLRISLKTFLVQTLIISTFSLIDSPEKPQEILSHHSGISPPYISTYLHFIKSLLE